MPTGPPPFRIVATGCRFMSWGQRGPCIWVSRPVGQLRHKLTSFYLSLTRLAWIVMTEPRLCQGDVVLFSKFFKRNLDVRFHMCTASTISYIWLLFMSCLQITIYNCYALQWTNLKCLLEQRWTGHLATMSVIVKSFGDLIKSILTDAYTVLDYGAETRIEAKGLLLYWTHRTSFSRERTLTC